MCDRCCSTRVEDCLLASRRNAVSTSFRTLFELQAVGDQPSGRDLAEAAALPLLVVRKLRVFFGDPSIRGQWTTCHWGVAFRLAVMALAVLAVWSARGLTTFVRVVLTLLCALVPVLHRCALHTFLFCVVPDPLWSADPLRRLYIVSRLHWFRADVDQTSFTPRVASWMHSRSARILYKPHMYRRRPLMHQIDNAFELRIKRKPSSASARPPGNRHSCQVCHRLRATQVCTRCNACSLCGPCHRAARSAEHQACPLCPAEASAEESCVVCMERAATHAFACGHECVCAECAAALPSEECPLCKKKSRAVRVWSGGARRCLGCDDPGAAVSPDHMFSGCGHRAVCKVCAERLGAGTSAKARCPLCRRWSRCVRVFHAESSVLGAV